MGFSSLALVMGAIGTLAFAPLNTTQISSASEAEMTTEQGLITPKANDPVIYTTESGLEIKYGNAAPSTINSSLGSGNLKGFPYFTTTSGSTTYTWVIIGRNANVTFLDGDIQSYLFSTWKSQNASQGMGFGSSFFTNTYEESTPAGNSIKAEIPSKSYVNDYPHVNISGVKATSEIPSGCVLVLANTSTYTGVYNTDYIIAGHTNARLCHWQQEHSKMNITVTMEGYYTNKSLGLASIHSQIQNTTLKTYECNWYANLSPGWAWRLSTATYHIFPLCASTDGGSNFMWKTYLTAAQFENGTAQALRASPQQNETPASSCYWYASYFESSAERKTGVHATGYAYRPAFVLKIT